MVRHQHVMEEHHLWLHLKRQYQNWWIPDLYFTLQDDFLTWDSLEQVQSIVKSLQTILFLLTDFPKYENKLNLEETLIGHPVHPSAQSYI